MDWNKFKTEILNKQSDENSLEEELEDDTHLENPDLDTIEENNEIIENEDEEKSNLEESNKKLDQQISTWILIGTVIILSLFLAYFEKHRLHTSVDKTDTTPNISVNKEDEVKTENIDDDLNAKIALVKEYTYILAVVNNHNVHVDIMRRPQEEKIYIIRGPNNEWKLSGRPNVDVSEKGMEILKKYL